MRKIILLLLCLSLWLLATPFSTNPTYAQTCDPTYNSRVQNGLISTPQIITGSKLGDTSGVCAIDPKAGFAPFKVPGYDDLKSLYYIQAKSSVVTQHELPTGNKTQADIAFTDSGDSVYHVNGDLTISNNNSGTHIGIVFVEGNLNITGNYCYGTTCPAGVSSNTLGTVFIVNKNVTIDPSVNRIDAIIVSAGIIYTAAATGSTCSLATNVTGGNSQLIINGSLISINQSSGATAPIQFCRKLSDNNQPAEKINQQVKYLVILRNLLSDTFQRWSETP